ncbi:MAG: diguanylate cyclase [Aquificaceae bacterium]|nr:diguanylate cyclase [Aquificaceae bacterium]MDW8423054.1 diguanylate cyclase [Aquificaceae bacterium]
MSIRKRIYLSLLLSVILTLLVSFLLLYLISSQLIEKRINETYYLVYNNYKEILRLEERNLQLLTEDAPLYGTYYYKKKISELDCKEVSYYRVLPTGPYFGINKSYPDGCYFVGVSLEEILKFANNLMGVEWVVYYERKFLKEILEVPLDAFMKGKIVLGDIVVDKLSKDKLLLMPLNVKGYTLYGKPFEKALLMEIPFTDAGGLPVGKIVLVKDISGIYREVYFASLVLALYSVFMASFLAFILFRIVSRLTSRIIFLKNVTARIEKMDFSVIEALSNSKDKCLDEVYELKSSVYNMALSLKSAFEELEKNREELQKLAYYDPLTELPNRRFFFDHATFILENSKRYGTPLSLLMMDLDHFKSINDTYGHEAGDLVLRSFAGVLKKSIRQSDLPARLGGEEFVLLMPNTNLQQARIVAERLRSNIQNTVVLYNGQEIKFTVSGGLTSFVRGIESVDELIRRADEALYRAKELGRNRVETYELYQNIDTS